MAKRRVNELEASQAAEGLPPGGGRVGALMRAFDWSRTDVGWPARWPRSLQGYVAMVLEMPTSAIIFWGPELTQIYNDGYAAIMGPRHPTYLAARFAACWPETYPVVHPQMRRVLENGEVVKVEREPFVLTRHGFPEEAYFTFTLSPLRGDDGRIAGIFNPVVEVTDALLRERRAETLARLAAQADAPAPVAENAMAALADNPTDVPMSLVYLAAPGGGLEIAAHTGLESFAAGELAAAPLGRIAREVYEENRPRELSDLTEALGGREQFGPWPEPTRRGYVVPLRRSAAEAARGVVVLGVSPRLHFDDGCREFFDAAARELSANLAAERAAKIERDLLARERDARREAELQKEHLAALLTQAPTPMVVLHGPEFVIELANPLTCRLWMREHDEVIGQPLLEALPELRDQVFPELLGEVYRTGESLVRKEVYTELARPEGGVEGVYLNFVYAPLRTTSGEVDGVLVIAFDVTDQVRAREEVNELRNAAEAANRAKDEFFAILGHELRNPLAPILTALELMRLRGAREVERERSVIERQAQHLVRLVDDLLDVSRITRGKIELTKERVMLSSVVAQAVETALPMIEERRHELSIDVPSKPELEADPGRLAQAIANLLTNAAKYTEPGGQIAVRAARRDGAVEVSVRDSGIGIDPEMLPRVFDVFVQERQPLARSEGGLGLGLAIVYGIVELHGGAVDVRSEGRGRGSEFVIKLPPAAEARDDDPGGRARAQRGGEPVGRRAILVVDDNADAADTLAAALEGAGHQVHVAYDAPGALRAAKEAIPDLALLDVGLPVMDGYELASQLRRLPGLDSLSAIAVTGYGQASDRERSREAGFDAHLVKPVDPVELDALVRSLPAPRERPDRPG